MLSVLMLQWYLKAVAKPRILVTEHFKYTFRVCEAVFGGVRKKGSEILRTFCAGV